MNDLTLEQAKTLKAIIERDRGKDTALERLAELALAFCDLFLKVTIAEMEERAAKAKTTKGRK